SRAPQHGRVRLASGPIRPPPQAVRSYRATQTTSRDPPHQNLSAGKTNDSSDCGQIAPPLLRLGQLPIETPHHTRGIRRLRSGDLQAKAALQISAAASWWRNVVVGSGSR